MQMKSLHHGPHEHLSEGFILPTNNLISFNRRLCPNMNKGIELDPMFLNENNNPKFVYSKNHLTNIFHKTNLQQHYCSNI